MHVLKETYIEANKKETKKKWLIVMKSNIKIVGVKVKIYIDEDKSMTYLVLILEGLWNYKLVTWIKLK